MQALRRAAYPQTSGYSVSRNVRRSVHRVAEHASEERLQKLLFVTSEMSDFVKAGGLGEVSAALPRALRQVHDIRVLIPGYPRVLAGRQVSAVARLQSAFGLPACDLGRIDMPD